MWSGQLLLLHLRKVWSQRRLWEEAGSVSLPLWSLPLPAAGKWRPLRHPAASSSSFLPNSHTGWVFSIRGLVFISHAKGKPGMENSKFRFNKDTWGINGKAVSDSHKKHSVPIKPCTGVTEQVYLFGQEYPGDSLPQGSGRDLLAGAPSLSSVSLGVFGTLLTVLLGCWHPPPPSRFVGDLLGFHWGSFGILWHSVAIVPTSPWHISQ